MEPPDAGCEDGNQSPGRPATSADFTDFILPRESIKRRSRSTTGLQVDFSNPFGPETWTMQSQSYSRSDSVQPPTDGLRRKSSRSLSIKNGISSRLRRVSISIRSALQPFYNRSTPSDDANQLLAAPQSHLHKTSSRPNSFAHPQTALAGPSVWDLAGSHSSKVHATTSSAGQYHLPLHAGAAARQAAARQNQLPKPPSLTVSPPTPLRLNHERESAVSLPLERSASVSSAHSEYLPLFRKDPLSVLPFELASLIFSELDYLSVARAERVSRSWHNVASDLFVWKSAFLRKYARSPSNPASPGPVGGLGIGRNQAELQEWKTMLRVRRQVDSNWKARRAAVTYLNGHRDSVYCVQYDENKIITGSRDQTIRVWDMHTNKCLKVIGAPSAFERDQVAVASSNFCPPAHYDMPVTSMQEQISSPSIYHVPEYFHYASILCLQYDNEILVTGSSDYTLIVWDIKTWQPIRRLAQHRGGVLDIAFDDKKIVSCSKDTTICVWDRASGALLYQMHGHRGPVNAVQMRGDLVVSASGEGSARLWNLNLSCPTISGRASTISVPVCVKEFWSIERGLACVEFSDDARYVLAGGNDQAIYKFSSATGERVSTLTGHTSLVRSLYLDEMNGRIVSGSYDLSLRVWDYATGNQMLDFPCWTASWLLSAKSDYRRIITTSQDGRVQILDFGHEVEDIGLLQA